MNAVWGSDLFWLYVVNIALGIVTLVCVLMVGGAVVRELQRRHAHRAVAADDHAFLMPELGATMADGGERLDRKQEEQPPEARA